MVFTYDVTIVTAIYNIRAIEKNKYSTNTTIETYLNRGKEFILNLPYNLVIFVDDPDDCSDDSDEYKKEVNHMHNIIKEHRIYPTYIYKLNLKKTYFYKYLPELTDLVKTFKIYNISTEKDTPHYIILNNNKFDFIKRAIDMNVFNSSHFMWIDFGINHVAKNVEMIHSWIDKIPNKIKQLCINPYVEDEKPKELFRNVYHHTAGGLFSGDIPHLLKYVELFIKKTNDIYEDNWYQLDEAVMSIVQKENPELFEMYYGDYGQIISNYNELNDNLYIIIQGLNKLMHNINKNHIFIINILNYISPYFKNNLNNDNNYNMHFFKNYNTCKHYINIYIKNNAHLKLYLTS